MCLYDFRSIKQKGYYFIMIHTEQEIPPYFGKHQQKVAIAYYHFLYFVFYFCSVHGTYALFTLDYPVLIFYTVVILLQRKVKRNQKYIDFVNNVIQVRKGLKDVELIYEQEIPETQKCLFGFHPHGVLSVSVLVYMNYKKGPLSNMVGMASRFMLSIPFVGVILRLWGIEGVHHSNMRRLMRKGRNIGLVPGGFQEATLTVTDQLRVYIKQRKGFIKYALEHNYTIYPVLSLNQHKLFWTFKYFIQFRLWLNKFKIPAVVFFNSKSGLFLPNDIEFVTLIGRGIKGKKYDHGERPTQQEVDQAHADYIEQIKRMHEKHKSRSGVPLKIY